MVDDKLATPFSLSGKRIWVAGHSGMMGSATVRRLAREDCEILAIRHADLDLRDQAGVGAWMKREKPDVVIVAAATVGGTPTRSRYARRSSVRRSASGAGSRPSCSRRASTNRSMSLRGQSACATAGGFDLPRLFPASARYFKLSASGLGSFAIGLLSVVLSARAGGAETARLFWMTGVLGGFTTYSAFALETVTLAGAGEALRAAAYVAVTVLACLVAAFAGRALGLMFAGD
jgi:fluoride ion exporter CrcB/FEX